MYSKAILRRPGKNLHKGITTANLGKPDFKKALRQHEEYCNVLLKCGLEVIVLEADENYPDGCFVEDTAILTEKIAIITRLGDKSRHGEEVEISKILSNHRKIIETINLPGNVDGGDALRVENHFYIGISRRTNKEGSRQLKEIFLKHGYSMSELQVESVLHLKTGITYLGKNNFISNYQFSKKMNSANIIVVDEDENYSANTLLINDFLLIPKGFIKSKQKILKCGFNIIEIDISEFRKMDGGMTCLSLLF